MARLLWGLNSVISSLCTRRHQSFQSDSFWAGNCPFKSSRWCKVKKAAKKTKSNPQRRRVIWWPMQIVKGQLVRSVPSLTHSQSRSNAPFWERDQWPSLARLHRIFCVYQSMTHLNAFRVFLSLYHQLSTAHQRICSKCRLHAIFWMALLAHNFGDAMDEDVKTQTTGLLQQ